MSNFNILEVDEFSINILIIARISRDIVNIIRLQFLKNLTYSICNLLEYKTHQERTKRRTIFS